MRTGRAGRVGKCDPIKICNAFHKNISILRSKMIKYNLLFDVIKRDTACVYDRPIYPGVMTFLGLKKTTTQLPAILHSVPSVQKLSLSSGHGFRVLQERAVRLRK